MTQCFNRKFSWLVTRPCHRFIYRDNKFQTTSFFLCLINVFFSLIFLPLGKFPQLKTDTPHCTLSKDW